jgi:hypothetical protein
MAVRLSCPSCNTAFTLPELPAERRATCPRCGDVFPIHSFTEVGEGEARSEPATPPAAGAAGRPRGWSVGRTVAVAVALGLVGLGLGLWFSRGGGKQPETPPQRPEDEVIPAAQLAGLGYLPADTNIAFAAQPGAVVAYARQRNQEPRDLLVKAGLPARLFDTLADLGLTLSQIDHIAGGTHVGDRAAELRLTLVLVLRQPLADEGQFREKLKAKPAAGKDRHTVELAGLPLTVARVSPTVWVFGFESTKDLEAVDRGGYGAGGKQFRSALAERIRQDVPPGAAAWLATDDDHWAEKPGVRFVLGQLLKKSDWLPVLARGRAAVAGLSFGEQPRVRLFVKTADEATGQQLRDYFKELASRDEKAQFGGGGELAFFEAPIDPADTFATLQRILGDARK